MKAVKITGKWDYMNVELDDGRKVRIYGELLVNGFAAEKNSIKKWTEPDGVAISEKERQEIIDAVLEETKDSSMEITFE